ncbi:aromatic-ring-hydroxylating dioxygenase subunit beta [uncultured Novosphingobium sp.]|uniref:aromatic-ring-hydroxylating dioxygenase subunit beta n=1 Tax=uncultured Novosphingobium sp. TaxID=292277 RepID=UPI002585514C|nr:aromatic-ring-hydroxylating dioxygenase subunit beta [uncultured Novosphingobium sp.]
MTASPVDCKSIDRATIEQFLFHEARLQDEHRYDEWEALWDDDALYWVPMREGADPMREVSYVYDNRARIASRVRQLKTGLRHAQAPQSKLRRTISNIEIAWGDNEVMVEANFVLIESRRQALTIWGGRTSYVLAPVGDDIKLRRKTVVLVNCEHPIDNLAFLI